MKKRESQKRCDDIARSLLELEELFGRKSPPDENAASGQCGAGDTGKELPAHDITAPASAQGGAP